MTVGRGHKGVTVVDGHRPDCPLCQGFMKSNGKQWRCTQCGKCKLKEPIGRAGFQEEEFNNIFGYDTDRALAYANKIESEYNAGKTKRFVFTSAQNNTGPFRAFFDSLKKYCDHNNARLAIIPSHYKNVTAWDKGDEKEWDNEFIQYLVHGDIELGKLLVRAHVKINATSVWPLSGKAGHGGDHWILFGHPQHAMESVPTPADMMPKRLYTTGSVTKKNYSVSDQGEKAKFNHVFGALVVEFDGDSEYPFIRTIAANHHGHFQDLDKKYSPNKVTAGQTIDVLVPGDEHVKFNTTRGPTYDNKDSIVKQLKPKFIARHDVVDCFSISHHHEKDPLLQFKKFHNKDNCAQDELDQAIRFINETTPKGCTTLMVESNHDAHLDKWLNRCDPNRDPVNALFIHHMRALQMREAYESDEITRAFQLYAQDKLKCKAKWLNCNQSFLIKDVDHSQHGDRGAHGARGSAKGFARSTFKMTIGHSHTPCIVHGVYQTGTSTGRMGYENGLSAHWTTHVIQYPCGKRTHIDIKGGKWRA